VGVCSWMERVVGEALEERGTFRFVQDAECGGEGVGVGAFWACDGDGSCGGAAQACVWVDEVGVADAIDFGVLDVGARGGDAGVGEEEIVSPSGVG